MEEKISTIEELAAMLGDFLLVVLRYVTDFAVGEGIGSAKKCGARDVDNCLIIYKISSAKNTTSGRIYENLVYISVP